MSEAKGFVRGDVLARLDDLEERVDYRGREIAGVRRRITRLEDRLDVDPMAVEVTADDLGTIVDVDGTEHELVAGTEHALHPAVAQVLVDVGAARSVEEGSA